MMTNASWIDTFLGAVLVGMAIRALAFPDSWEIALFVLQKIREGIE